jgi:hypothetical protein
MRLPAGDDRPGAKLEKTQMPNIPTADVVALVRRRYQDGAAVKAIVAETGLKNLTVFYRCIAGLYPDGSGAKPAPIPQRRAGVRVRHRAGSRAALVTRMWRTAERQVEEIEERLAAVGLELSERESNARTLAVVARTLRELSAVDAARTKEASKSDNDDPVPRDIDGLRQALADKLEAFVASRSAAVRDDAE